jgi:hypothetical protein
MSNDREKNPNKDSSIKPEPETLHTTDPQEEMKGPVSSFMNNVKDEVEQEGKKINPDPDDTNRKND